MFEFKAAHDALLSTGNS